jgi:hypothetical protein
MRRVLVVALVSLTVLAVSLPTASAQDDKRISMTANDRTTIEYPADTAFYFRHGFLCDGAVELVCADLSRAVADVHFYEVVTKPTRPGYFFQRLKAQTGLWPSPPPYEESVFGSQKWFTGYPAGERHTFATLMWMALPGETPTFETYTITIEFVGDGTGYGPWGRPVGMAMW